MRSQFCLSRFNTGDDSEERDLVSFNLMEKHSTRLPWGEQKSIRCLLSPGEKPETEKTARGSVCSLSWPLSSIGQVRLVTWDTLDIVF